jgi:hypothetical protein
VGIFGLPKALTEMGNCAKAILPTMTDPTVSKEDKRITLNTMVNELSDGCFRHGVIADQIMIIINMQEEECKKFPNTKAQVDSILVWLPRMKQHQDRLTKKVAQNRKSFGLEDITW